MPETLSGDYTYWPMSRDIQRLLQGSGQSWTMCVDHSPFSVKLSSLFDLLITAWELELLT